MRGAGIEARSEGVLLYLSQTLKVGIMDLLPASLNEALDIEAPAALVDSHNCSIAVFDAV